ncbi:lipoate--protein ligase family protein [Bacillus horti]|uniref:Octanoyltransferase LipM n=1 Tax=Caldalkalibacillus horti TaxID=77523 RepID=A0ABT9W1B9_9BACI|nr:biotin/lipoate A/B protein ligase family protein [Bacillus horti]MDQ0166910.1 lipoate-protein ligase A [Bacillus horti]
MELSQTWRFIDSGDQDSATNMAIDEAILTANHEGLVPPTIRFYTWKPATLTVGYFQKAAKEIDLEAVRRHNLGFVRRLTGGRAVLHDQELTYSVVIAEKQMPQSVTEAYREISQGLLYGFKELGLNAYFSVPATKEQKQALRQPQSAVCFDASSWYELVVEGRKVAGSAQTRQKGVVLQHGSIPLTIDIDMLYDVFRFSNERVKERLKAGFAQKAVAINELRQEAASISEVKAAFKKGFAQGFGVSLQDGELTAREQELVEELVRTKYGMDTWNFKS